MRYEMDGYFMSGDKPIARIENGLLTATIDNARLPLYLQCCNDLDGWLRSRAADRSRGHVRLIEDISGLTAADDADFAMFVHAAKLTDNFWVKRDGERLTYAQVRFKQNTLADTALSGVKPHFQPGKRVDALCSPEFTNTGSFEKCWRREKDGWWLYKSGSTDNHYAEMFMERIGLAFGIPMAHYELAEGGKYIRSKDLTNGGEVNLDHASGLIGSAYDDYPLNYKAFSRISPDMAAAYLDMLYMDALCCNTDRHENNYGVLRSAQTGEVISFAPLFDHNLALFAGRSPAAASRSTSDRLIDSFCSFVYDKNLPFRQPHLLKPQIEEIVKSIPIPYDTKTVTEFIFDRQERLKRYLTRANYAVMQDDPPYTTLDARIQAASAHIPSEPEPSPLIEPVRYTR